MQEQLKNAGFFLLPIEASESLSLSVSAHVDLNVVKIIDTLLVRDEIAKQYPFLRKMEGVRISEEAVVPKYPDEAKFCVKVLGNTLYHGKTVAEDITGIATEYGLICCEVRQGYVACNLLSLDDTHAITSDPSLYKVLTSRGVEVLLIREGYISLPPYPYGFIGGAGSVRCGKVYFLGDVMTHPDGKEIVDFITSCQMEVCCLGERELFDGGGLVFWDVPSSSGIAQDTQDNGKQRNEHHTE